MIKEIKTSILDVNNSIHFSHIWYNFALSEIKGSYKRTKLGPIWICISTFVLLAAMGPLYSTIFNVEISKYFLYIICGFTFWEFIKVSIIEMSKIYTESDGIILAQPYPMSLYIFKCLTKNIIILLHNLVIVVIVTPFLAENVTFSTLFFFIGIIINIIILFFSGLIIGVLCTRFRDITQIINSILTVMFFLTPILWFTELVGDRAAFIYGNIFFLMIDIIRTPLTLGIIPIKSLLLILIYLFLIIPTSLVIFGKFKGRIPFWI